MLDIKAMRAEPDRYKVALGHKGVLPHAVDEILDLDARRRCAVRDAEDLKAQRRRHSEEVGRRKQAGEEPPALVAAGRELGDRIRGLDAEVAVVEEELRERVLSLPNLPHESVPVGADETANQEVRRWGEPRQFTFTPKAHWDLGTALDILDFERAGKVAGSRFTFYKGLGAKLERACINFMLEVHTGKGYTEILPPYMVNPASLVGTGQLPKLKEEMFEVQPKGFYLIPTAEVPVTNLHRDEIIPAERLPVRYAAYSACFRAEAGAAGRDTRGLIRQHQFNKVELVKFVLPGESYGELESLTEDAAEILRLLDLPYRVLALATGDLSFASAKTYDLEVWLPSYNGYKEISSCSNFEDFQARRAEIRYRPAGGGKTEYLHTLNGSGLAVGRTVAAILENYQNEDGSITVPKVLQPFMGVERIG